MQASGKVQIRRVKRTLRLRRATRTLYADRRQTLLLRIPKKAKRRLAIALQRRRKATALVRVTGRDSAGNTTRESRRIRIVR